MFLVSLSLVLFIVSCSGAECDGCVDENNDGGWYRSPDMPDNYGGFFGNTRFIYGDESKGEYFVGTNHMNQDLTNSFAFVAAF